VVWYDAFREFDRVTRGSWMPMDAVRQGDQVELRFDLPGVAPDTIDVDVERNVLTVKAERHWAPANGDQVLARERTQGTFSRQVLLGDALDPERLEQLDLSTPPTAGKQVCVHCREPAPGSDEFFVTAES